MQPTVAKELSNSHFQHGNLTCIMLNRFLSFSASMSTKTFLSAVTVATLFEASTSAICPRYNFGITQTQSNTNPD